MTAKNEFRPLAEQDKAEALQIFRDGFADLQARNDKVNESVQNREAENMKALLDDHSASFWGCYEDDTFIGFAALTRPNAIIQHYLSTSEVNTPADIREVRLIYVKKEWQGQGYGRALVNTLLNELEKEGASYFCTDAGYKTSQAYWTELIGTPTKGIKDYWGKNEPHMIWIARTERVLDDLHDPYRPTENTRY